MKKPYVKPAVIHTETIEARATTCLKESSAVPSCQEGPVQS